jgi:hypothetical protein
MSGVDSSEMSTQPTPIGVMATVDDSAVSSVSSLCAQLGWTIRHPRVTGSELETDRLHAEMPRRSASVLLQGVNVVSMSLTATITSKCSVKYSDRTV